MSTFKISEPCRIGAFFLVILSLNVAHCDAEVKRVEIKRDNRPLIVFETFGFNPGGVLELNVSDMQIQSVKQGPAIDLSSMGFFLSSEEDSVKVFGDFNEDSEQCILKMPSVKVLVTLRNVLLVGGFNNSYSIPKANEFTLFFENCQPHFSITMNVRTAMYNLEGKTKIRNYLSVGQTPLPVIYLSFSLVYLFLGAAWMYICLRYKENAHRIHFLMGIVVFLKALNLLAEAEDKLYTGKFGFAHGWDVVFYVFGALRGIMLFTVLVLIGTGWSVVKPFLQEKEKKVLMVVIPLQVLANVASVIIDETSPATKYWFTWKQLFVLLDVICCCAVLLPIIWSIKHFKEASHTDGKAAKILLRLRLFRHFYIVIISYLYFTRILVFAFSTVTTYKYRWLSFFCTELATLAFYIFTGFTFQPAIQNPYLVLDDEQDDDAAQESLHDADFDL